MKGNGIMDYLMAYGWVLLVIIVVGAAFFALTIRPVVTDYTVSEASFCEHFNATYENQLCRFVDIDENGTLTYSFCMVSSHNGKVYWYQQRCGAIK